MIDLLIIVTTILVYCVALGYVLDVLLGIDDPNMGIEDKCNTIYKVLNTITYIHSR